MWGVVGTSMGDQTDGGSPVDFLEPETDVKKLPEHDAMKACLAVCHSLTRVDGELV